MANDLVDPANSAPVPLTHFPTQEANRLAVLRSLALLDTPPSEAFDRITRLTAKILEVPIVLVSLVDDTRQWFKSRFGLDVAQTPRDISFCTHAIRERRPFVVSDASVDPRFAANPLVTGSPHIRAYAGIPIYTRDGHAICTLCAIDRMPRHFDDADITALTDFAKILEDRIQATELAAHTETVLHFANDREKLFRETFEIAAVGMVHADLAGRLIRVNARTCEMLGYAAHELNLVSVVDLTHPDDLIRSTAVFRELVAGRIDRYRIEKRLLKKDGIYIWAHLAVALKRSHSGQAEYLIAVIEDVSARMQTDADLLHMQETLKSQIAERTLKLQESNAALRNHVKNLFESESAVRQVEHRLRAIADNVPAMIGYWNNELRCEFANQGYRAFFGISPEKIVGMQMRDLLGETLFQSAEPHTRMALQGHAQRFEHTLTKPDGTRSYLEVQYVPDMNEAATVRGFFVHVTDTTTSQNIRMALEAANAKLANDSATDYLTQLANRRAFSQRSEDASRRFKKNGEIYGLILLDLDNFKQINDLCGHDAGDDVLRAVGRLLKSQLRSHRDVAARLGGEEFAMLCFGDLDEQLLRQVAEGIRALINLESVRSATGNLRCSGSFGLAISRIEDSDWKDIYSRADSALYAAKVGGKDRVMFGKTYIHGATGRFKSLEAASGE